MTNSAGKTYHVTAARVDDSHTRIITPSHSFAPAEQDRHFRMAKAIRDRRFLLARGMGAGVYFSMGQAGIRPVITDIAIIDEAALETAQGIIVDHKE